MKARLIAHRCGGAHAPENTLAGLHAAARLGFEAVEFDVMLAACGTPVLIHDETLERTTNGTGRVCEMPFAALRALDAGSWFHPNFAGERIPTLAEAIALADALGLQVNVEIKPAQGFEQATASAVARALRGGGCGGEPPLLSSFSIEALQVARPLAPELPRALLVEDVPRNWRSRLDALGAVALHCEASKLTSAQIARCVAAGVPLRCYTVNDEVEARRLFDAGVSAVFTDCLLPGSPKLPPGL